jgi:hypothetical protein
MSPYAMLQQHPQRGARGPRAGVRHRGAPVQDGPASLQLPRGRTEARWAVRRAPGRPAAYPEVLAGTGGADRAGRGHAGVGARARWTCASAHEAAASCPRDRPRWPPRADRRARRRRRRVARRSDGAERAACQRGGGRLA